MSTFGNNVQPTLAAEMTNVTFTDAEHGVEANGVAGHVALASFSPLATPGNQTLSVQRLKYGDNELTDGHIRFAIDNGAVVIDQTNWHFLGGEVAASNVRLAAGATPMQVTLEAKDVQLRDLLDKFAKGKAKGEGTLNGRLPMTITKNGIVFGDGFLVGERGGTVSVTDVETIVPIADAAAQNAAQKSQAQVKQNIIDALKDFEFRTLRAELRNDENGRMTAYVRMAGRGRSGARQALDYDLKVTGLDYALRSLFKLKEAVNVSGKL